MITYTARDGTLVMAAIEYADAADRATMLEHCRPSDRDNVRAGLDALADREAAWLAGATPQQEAIGWGDHFTILWQRVMIYGRCLGLDEFKRRERAASPTGSEYRRSLRHTLAAYDRGWRYAECYSTVEPGGELGDMHVALMAPLTAAGFAAARAGGWPS